MILRSISTVRFRNLEAEEIRFHPSVNLLVGDNGQGKTNLLEAVYFLGTTKSFRTSSVDRLIRRGDSIVYVAGKLETAGGIEKTMSIGVEAGESRKRELQANGQRVPLGTYLELMPLFAYSSARLEIIRGGPEERRRFIDRGVASIDPGHLKRLSRYGQVLKQRNAVLQAIRSRNASGATLEPWNVQLIQAAAPVVAARSAYVAALTTSYAQVTAELGYHVDNLELDYRPAGLGADADLSVKELERVRTREVSAGHSLVGPHRDVLEMLIDGQPALDYLSGGELKMTVLLLKLAKIRLYLERRTEPPLFLLDDLDAELDLSITRRLLEQLVGFTQIVTTSAKKTIFNELEFGAHKRFQIEHGSVVSSHEYES